MGFNSVFKGLKRRKGKWIGHILLRNCLVKPFTEGKTEEAIREGK